ncbi:hypothetical protein B0H14DRAFT_3449586 [Mycena olivaceomarginata]|nr:hypothetical protein B0H14DRAFT_3449586 [Mycena olivaceomarginata]
MSLSLAWQENGIEGFLVCKFAFKRLPGQPPLPRRADDALDEDATSKGAQGDMAPVEDSESTAV